MPATALQHFREDISRAQAILNHADTLPTTSDSERMLRSDLFRSAWMFGVGALDAYFCDAYTDIVAAALSSKSRQPAITLPDFFFNIKLPVRAILEQYTNQNWPWRMAARKMMEKENVLRFQVIKDLFNKFFRRGFKLFNDLLDLWMRHQDAKIRLFGVTTAAYLAMNGTQQEQSRTRAMEKLEERSRKSSRDAMTASTIVTARRCVPKH